MKVPIAYYLLLLYVTVMLKPLMPIVTDALSHTFSEAIHIATVHALYGSNHLEKELSDTTPDNANTRHQSTIGGEDQASVHFSTGEFTYNFDLNAVALDYSLLKLYRLRPGFIIKNFQPPRFS